MEMVNSSSPISFTASDNLSDNPRFIELQEELRCVLFAGLSTFDPSRPPSPRQADQQDLLNNETSTSSSPSASASASALALLRRRTRNIHFANLSIPKIGQIRYFQNWIVECAPFLDKFDEDRHFQIQVPLMAQTSPALLNAMLAFSARQMERSGALSSSSQSYDSIELYQESIRLLAPSLQARNLTTLVTACILAVFELMSGSSKDWRRHIEGCTALFQFFDVNGFSGGVAQAVFWCYARMELCGAIISNGSETTILPLGKWVPPPPEGLVTEDAIEEFVTRDLFLGPSRSPDMYANWSVYLCAKVCDLIHRRTRYLELGEPDPDSRPFLQQWEQLWATIQLWLRKRPEELLPNQLMHTSTRNENIFPTIFFRHWAAISSNSLYHTACILMLEAYPHQHASKLPQYSPIWHARQICGISCTNPHRANLINSIQPLYTAGRLLTHPAERIEVAKLLKLIDRTTGWGALWRLRDLEVEWGYEPGEMFEQLSDAAYK